LSAGGNRADGSMTRAIFFALENRSRAAMMFAATVGTCDIGRGDRVNDWHRKVKRFRLGWSKIH